MGCKRWKRLHPQSCHKVCASVFVDLAHGIHNEPKNRENEHAFTLQSIRADGDSWTDDRADGGAQQERVAPSQGKRNEGELKEKVPQQQKLYGRTLVAYQGAAEPARLPTVGFRSHFAASIAFAKFQPPSACISTCLKSDGQACKALSKFAR